MCDAAPLPPAAGMAAAGGERQLWGSQAEPVRHGLGLPSRLLQWQL